MIDTVNLKGRKLVIIDELSFGYPLDLESDSTGEETEDKRK